MCIRDRHRFRGPSLYRAAESEAVWAKITAPTAFIDGEKSMFMQAVEPPVIKARRDLFPAGYQETVIPDAGHMLHFDEPEATAAAIRDFLLPAG